MVDFKVFFSILFFQNIHFNDPSAAERFQNGIIVLAKLSLRCAVFFSILGIAIQYMVKKAILFIGALAFFGNYLFVPWIAYISAMEEKDKQPDSNWKKDEQYDSN